MKQFDLGSVQIKKRNRLPHWLTAHGIYVGTWHLADALPADALAALQREQEYEIERIRRGRGQLTIADRARIELDYRRKIERALDRGFGDCILRAERCAGIVAASLVHFDTTRYELYTWSVMPNHVHVVFSPCENWSISEIMKAWKGFTAKELNRALGSSGTVWQEDYFDRSMRNENQFRRTVDYVMNNPAAAGLRDWKFVASYPGKIANVV